MKSTVWRGDFVVTGALLGFFFASVAFGTPVEISYTVSNLESDRWEYTYTVDNFSLEVGIEEFTIWFDYGLYDDLAITTTVLEGLSTNWSEVFWDPEPVLLDDGAYDAKTLGLGIGIGENVSGFSVSFDWLGAGEPGSQLYHIVNPDNYPVPIETGYTVPEPTTLFLIGLGGLLLRRKPRRRN